MSPTPTLVRVDVVVAPVNGDKSFSGVAYVQIPADAGKIDPHNLGCMAMAREVFYSGSGYLDDGTSRETHRAANAAAVAPGYKNGRSGGTSVVEQIKTIMGRKTLGTQSIYDALVANGWQTRSAYPKRMILHLLVTNSKGRNSTFKRVGRGQYVVR